MFTPSIVLLMIINTVAASGAVFVALQASALETGDRVSASTASAPHATGITAELPDLDEKDVSLEIANGVLSISGEKKSESEDKARRFTGRESGFAEGRRRKGGRWHADQKRVPASQFNRPHPARRPRRASDRTQWHCSQRQCRGGLRKSAGETHGRSMIKNGHVHRFGEARDASLNVAMPPRRREPQ
jgi:hypothetical protein